MSSTQPTDDADTPESPWYAGGLAFECTQCGNCCTGGEGAVWVSDEEIAAIATLTSASIGEVRYFRCRVVQGRQSLREQPNGNCIYFDGQTRRCTIYAARPRQCRTWPFWPGCVETPERWQQVGEICPGLNRGRLVPLTVIRQACDGSPGS